MKKMILFFGGVRDFEFETFKEQGFNVGVIIDLNYVWLTQKANELDFIKSLPIQNYTDDLAHNVELIIKDQNVHAVICLVDVFTLTFSLLADKLSIPSPSVDSVRLCNDKIQMHKEFVAKIGQYSTAKFKQIRNKDDIINNFIESDFPIILKPNNLHSSMFVSLNKNEAELIQNYELSCIGIEKHFERVDSNNSSEIYAEEFLSGKNYSVDCIVTKSGYVYPTPVIDVITGKDIGREDFHHFARLTPSMLPKEQQYLLHKLAVEGVMALRLTSCVAHVEFVFKGNKPKLLEIAARPGANRARLLKQAYDFELIESYLKIIEGKQEITIKNIAKNYFSVITPYPATEGKLIGFNDEILEEIKGQKTFFNMYSKVKVGQIIGSPLSGRSSSISIELKSTELSDVIYDIEYIKNVCKDIFIIEN